MTPSQIQPNMKFGHWEVIKFSHNNNHRIKYFLCKCDVCGSIRPVRGTALIDGTSTACSAECANTLVGQNFGDWKVLAIDKSRKRHFVCQCKCGTQKSVFGPSLKNGTSKSCGCVKNKNTKMRFEENAKSHIGERYGKLTVCGHELKENNYYYICKCDCGNNIKVLGKRLFNGTTYSCGCINSKANTEMEFILKELNIPYKREYRFEDCKDKGTLPFDFALFNNYGELIGLIENNGSQHYSSRGTQWNTPERLIYTQRHDYIKAKYAEDNNIPLLIIPYQYFNELKKFLITSDFWQIIIKNFND